MLQAVSSSYASAAMLRVVVLLRPRTRLVLEDASQLVLAGVLAEVPDEERVAGRIILCVCDGGIAPRLHRHLQPAALSGQGSPHRLLH